MLRRLHDVGRLADSDPHSCAVGVLTWNLGERLPSAIDLAAALAPLLGAERAAADEHGARGVDLVAVAVQASRRGARLLFLALLL